MRLIERILSTLLITLLALLPACQRTVAPPVRLRPQTTSLPIEGDSARQGLFHLVILHTGDMHGNVLPTKVGDDATGKRYLRGGMSALAAYVKSVRAQLAGRNAGLLLIDCGDFFQGTAEGDLTRGQFVVELMNAIGYDAVVIGNHDLDFGEETLAELAQRAGFVFLSANLLRKSDMSIPVYARPYLIKEFSGITVGVLGLTTSELMHIISPELAQELVVLDETEAVALYRGKLLRKGVDLLVLATHCGLERDLELARKLKGVCCIVGGHSHSLTEKGAFCEQTAVLVNHAGARTMWVGRIDVIIELATGRVVSKKARVISISPELQGRDEVVEGIISRREPEISRLVDIPIGEAAEDLLCNPDEHLWCSSPLGNLICDIMREVSGAEVVIYNRGGIRAQIARGRVTLRQLRLVLPFDNRLVILHLRGRYLREVLEEALRQPRFLPEVSGLRCEYDPQAEPLHRVKEVFIGEHPLEPDRLYLVATNSFLAKGGDGYKAFLKAEKKVDTGKRIRQLVVDYFKAHSPVRAPVEKRVRPARR